MADLRYQVQVDTRGAAQNLQQLQGRVGGLQSAFGGLKTALGALAFGSVIRGAVGFAAAVNDMSSATNVSRQSILGLGQALTTNGGQASRATDAVQRFSLTMGQAAEGSKTAQSAFASVGISLQELGTLDESELLARTIEGLGAIEDSGRRAAIQTQIFGKTMAGVNAAGLAGDFRRLAEEQERNAEAVRKAGEAQDKLNAAMNRFQLAVIRTIEPMVDAFNRLSDEQIATLIDGIVKLAAALVALTAAIKGFQILAGVFAAVSAATVGYLAVAKTGFTGLATTLAAGKVQVAGFLKAFGAASGVFGKVGAVLTTVGVLLTKRIPFGLLSLLKFIPVVGALAAKFSGVVIILLKVGTVIGAIAGALIGINAAIRAAFNVDPIERAIAAARRLGETLGLIKSDPGAGIVDITGSSRGNNRGSDRDPVRDTINKQLEQEQKNVRDVTRAYQDQLAEFNRKFALQTRLTRLSDEQRLVEETMAEAQQEYLARIEPLVKRIRDLKESGNANDQEAIPAIKQGIADITAEYNAQLPILQELISARLQEMNIQKEQVRLEQLATEAADRRIAIEENVRDIIINGQKKIQAAYEQLELDGLGGIARELRRVEIEERRLAEAARERVAAQFGDNDPAGLARAMEEINAATDEVIRRRQDAARRVFDEQRSFANGWKRAFNEYRDNATNAAATAERLFRTATRGMEDSIVGFAKTGKFEWKNFLAIMLEELLRSQVQVIFAQMMGSMQGSMQGLTGGAQGTGGNLLQQLGGFIGGMGQQQQQQQPVRTPGINPAAEPNVFGTLTQTLGRAVSGISDTVGSVVRGIGSIFGGFFATGGTLPKGRIGVVGERGPELIRGPADITPITGMGGVTNVTYNISAVDARSFQQLVARDPGFIYGVTELGRRQLARG